MKTAIVATLLAALLTACASPTPVGPVIESPAPSQAWQAHYAEQRRLGEPVFEVDPAHSLVTVDVRRGGSMAELGHDHVVASHCVRGFVTPREGRADLSVPLRELVVDEPELRQAAGFTSQPSTDAIEATRLNMLKTLHADQHPLATVALTGVAETGGAKSVEALVSLNGVQRTDTVQITIETSAQAVHATGSLSIHQTDYGIRPYSVLAGALRVEDLLTIHFDVVAHRSRETGADNFDTACGSRASD